jgi:hypothetical protein
LGVPRERDQVDVAELFADLCDDPGVVQRSLQVAARADFASTAGTRRYPLSTQPPRRPSNRFPLATHPLALAGSPQFSRPRLIQNVQRAALTVSPASRYWVWARSSVRMASSSRFVK